MRNDLTVQTPFTAPAPSGRFFRALLLLAVAASPLQYALTIPLGGSPLKVSEVALLLAFIVWPLSRPGRLWARGSGLIAIFALLLGISSLINLVSNTAVSHETVRGGGRSADADLIFYAFLAAFALLSWKTIASLGRERIERALVVATWICAIATAIQFVGVLTGQEALLEVMGFRTVGSSDDGYTMVSTRGGPFLEGQHLGFFAGFALIVCLYRRSWCAAVAAGLCLFYAQSTTGLVGLAAAALAVLVLRFNLKAAIGLLMGGIVGLFVFCFSDTVRESFLFQLSKLGLFPDASGSGDSMRSLNVRGIKSEIAWNIMSQHPLLGVGPGRYSVWFYDEDLSYTLPTYYFRDDHRAIAENAYAQIGAELGVVALMVFIFFIAVLFFSTVRSKDAARLAVIAYVGVAMWTQSSWTFLPIWVALALVAARSLVSEAVEPQGEEESSLRGSGGGAPGSLTGERGSRAR